MVRTALDACKETYVGSYSKPPHVPLSDEEWVAGKPEPDPRQGMSKTYLCSLSFNYRVTLNVRQNQSGANVPNRGCLIKKSDLLQMSSKAVHDL